MRAPPLAARRGRAAGLQLLVAGGGCAALSWEVVWQLQSSLALGVSALGAAITLAATMAGMTAGSLLAAAWLRGREAREPHADYAILEAVIGGCGLLALPGFALLESLDGAVWRLWPAAAPVVHALGILLLLGPPTMAMGATVPVFERVARANGLPISRLYAMNVAGASVGVLALALLVLPRIGVQATVATTAGLNLAVALSMLGLGRRARRVPASAPAAPARRATVTLADPRRALLVVACTGFVTFGLEVAWFRAMRAAYQSVTDSFAIILASVLIPLALASRIVPALRRAGLSPSLLLAIAGAAVLVATPLVERIDLINAWAMSQLGPLAASYTAVRLVWLGLSLALLGPAILALGTLLPWLLDEARDLGEVGRMYAVNTAASVAGSLVTAWALLPWLGFARSAWVLGLLPAALALRLLPERRLAPLALPAAALLVAVLGSSSIGRDRLVNADVMFDDYEIVDYDEGPDATVSVVRVGEDERNLVIDGFVATAEGKASGSYMEWMGRLPMLLHPDPATALVICFGTGQTAHAVRDEGPERLDVVELSPAVLRMAAHFDSNHDVLQDERVEAIVMDGRAWLRRTPRRYDVITLEPMPPNFAGVNALYSREFYELALARLAPGGIAAQWLPVHILPVRYARAVAATFHSVFPDSLLWVSRVDGTGVLLGRKPGEDTAEPLGSTWPGMLRETLQGRRPVPAGRVVLGREGMARYAATGEWVTDDNQLLAYGDIRRHILERGPRAVSARSRRDLLRHASR